jgi:hypothetical protein
MSESSIVVPLVDLVIAFTLVECIALVLYHRASGKGVAPRDFLANMVSGVCLMLALRSLVHDAGAAWIVLSLLAAGIAQGSDLWMRWRRESLAAPATPQATA